MLGEKHTDWIKMLKSMMRNKGVPLMLDDETAILSEMYIRMDKYIGDDNIEKIMYGDEINTMFVYITIKNTMNAYFNTKNRNREYPKENVYFSNPEDEIFKEYNIQYNLDVVNLSNEITEEIESWHWFSARMFKIINEDGVSMRQLSRDTGISLSTIFNLNKKSKQLLINKFKTKYNKL